MVSQNEQPDDVTGEFAGWFAEWGKNGQSALKLISGYSELLLAGKFGPVNDEQRDALEIIRLGTRQAWTCWEEPRLYLQLRTESALGADHPLISLNEIIAAACRQLWEDFKIEPRLAVPAGLPAIGGFDLATALYFLMCPHFRYMIRLQNHPPQLTVNKDSPAAITVQVKIRTAEIQPPTVYPGSRLAIAELLLRRYGGQLRLAHIPCDETKFEFTLEASSL